MTITLWVNGQPLEMPGVTTCGYAAARVAAAAGLDPNEGPYHLQIKGELLPEDELIVGYDGATVEALIRVGREYDA